MNERIVQTAVLVIDLQEISFSEPEAAAGREPLLAQVIRLLNHARMQNWHVFFVREGFAEDLHDAPPYARSDKRIVADSPEMQFVHELAPYIHPAEEVIKKRHSALDGTHLKDRLLNLDVENLVLVGVNSDACILTTAMNSRQDFQVYVPKECVGSRSATRQMAALEILGHKVHVLDLDSFLAQSLKTEFSQSKYKAEPNR